MPPKKSLEYAKDVANAITVNLDGVTAPNYPKDKVLAMFDSQKKKLKKVEPPKKETSADKKELNSSAVNPNEIILTDKLKAQLDGLKRQAELAKADPKNIDRAALQIVGEGYKAALKLDLPDNASISDIITGEKGVTIKYHIPGQFDLNHIDIAI